MLVDITLLTTSGSSHYKVLHDNTDRQVVTMVIGLSLTANSWLFMVTNIGKFSPHHPDKKRTSASISKSVIF